MLDDIAKQCPYAILFTRPLTILTFHCAVPEEDQPAALISLCFMKCFLHTLRFLLLVALFAVPMAGSAQYFYVDGIAYYTFDGIEAYVTSSWDSYRGDIEIPETVTGHVWIDYEEYDGTYTVVGVDEYAFYNCDQLTGVVLPNTIRTINRNAFYGCSALSSITLPSSLTYIGSTAFGYCTSLQSITIPNQVSSMDWNVFYCCTGLRSVTLSNSLTQLNGTFFGCTGLTSVEIPASVNRLDGTFTGCTGLTSITVPAAVNYIGSRTFEGCSALTTAVLPSSLTYIAEQAFFNCENLHSVTCLAATPPSMYTYTSECFDYSTYMDGLLHVPSASIELYRNTDWWSLFNNIQGLMSLNATSVTLQRGRTFGLAIVCAPGFTPSAPVSWESSNPAIVTVSANGLLRAISVGQALVYASVDNEEVTCEVTIIAGEVVPGDLDGDGILGISDITLLIDVLLDGNGDPSIYDIDGDGLVGISDVTTLIDMLLNG